MGYQISRHYTIVQYLNILKYDTPFNLLISRLPNIVEKSFCTPDEAMDPTFQICPSLLAYVWPEKLSKNCGAFLLGFFRPPFSIS